MSKLTRVLRIPGVVVTTRANPCLPLNYREAVGGATGYDAD